MIKSFEDIDKGPMPGKPFVTPINLYTLSFGDKRKALQAVNMIKEKICGKIKVITCAGGSKQKNTFRRERESRHIWCLWNHYSAHL